MKVDHKMSLAIQYQVYENPVLDKKHLDEQLDQMTNQLEMIYKLMRNKVKEEIKLDYNLQMSMIQSIGANIKEFS